MKGKEYINNELIFEGEYLEGKIWKGNVTEYYYKGELKFEGKYFHGQIQGDNILLFL